MTLTAIKNGTVSLYEYIEVDQAGGTANDSDTHLVAYSLGFKNSIVLNLKPIKHPAFSEVFFYV